MDTILPIQLLTKTQTASIYGNEPHVFNYKAGEQVDPQQNGRALFARRNPDRPFIEMNLVSRQEIEADTFDVLQQSYFDEVQTDLARKRQQRYIQDLFKKAVPEVCSHEDLVARLASKRLEHGLETPQGLVDPNKPNPWLSLEYMGAIPTNSSSAPSLSGSSAVPLSGGIGSDGKGSAHD